MAIQQRQTALTDVVQTYGKIPQGRSAEVDNFGVPKTITGVGVVDHTTGSVELVRGVPLRVHPLIDAGIVQNTMHGRSQMLYASEHGSLDGAWLSVPGMSCIEFDKPIYLMQEDYDEYRFPIASK